jgi:high-affinity iron transporter
MTLKINFLKFGSTNQFFIFILLFFFLATLPSLGLAKATPEVAIEKAKKVVMMLDILAKEYKLAIENGTVVNPAEYEESRIFLEQSFERYQTIIGYMPNLKNSEVLKKKFTALRAAIKNKHDPSEITIAANTISSQLLKELGIEISKLPTRAINIENGKTIFKANCTICHGITGGGDGPLSSKIDPVPAVLSDPKVTGNKHSTAYDNYQVISVGVANTLMMAWSEILPEDDLWDVTYYIRTFSNKNLELPVVTTTIDTNRTSGSTKQAIADVIRVLNLSIKAFKAGEVEKSAEIAFDAYLSYETIETGLVTKNKELGLRLESSFGRLRAEIKRGADLDHVKKINQNIQNDLHEAQTILEQKVGFTGLFLQSFSIIVREGFEAILIVAALIAFLVKSRNKEKIKVVYRGVTIGIIASFLTAYIIHEVLNISMAKQELLEGCIMLVAVVVLFWVSYWLLTKIETQKWQSYITGKMTQAITTGNVFALGMVAFLAVYREGFETVLFYKALYLYAGEISKGIIPGFLVGCVFLAGMFVLINKIGVKVPIKWFFGFTSILLYFMAFTFMGKGIHELQMGEAVSLTAADFAPEISWLGMYPTWETFIAQSLLLIIFLVGIIYTFVIKPEVDSKDLLEETSHIQNDIGFVHDLAEHISDHAQRCELFLKDTKDKDLQELSGHLKEIDSQVHELSDHVRSLEEKLIDGYERLGFAIMPKKKKPEPPLD